MKHMTLSKTIVSISIYLADAALPAFQQFIILLKYTVLMQYVPLSNCNRVRLPAKLFSISIHLADAALPASQQFVYYFYILG